MYLSEDTCIAMLRSYDRTHWAPLFALIPKIEATERFGEMIVDESEDDAPRQLHYYSTDDVVEEFFAVLTQTSILVDFDWPQWTEGKAMVRDEAFDFDTVDLATKCKLLTAIVRSDRFMEGALVAAFESGVVLRLLRSMEREVMG